MLTHLIEEDHMKRIILLMVAAAAICTAVPASAQTVVIREGGMHRNHDGYHRDRGYRARAEWRHRDRGYYRGEQRGRPAIVITR